jgi:hypothetical protein
MPNLDDTKHGLAIADSYTANVAYVILQRVLQKFSVLPKNLAPRKEEQGARALEDTIRRYAHSATFHPFSQILHGRGSEMSLNKSPIRSPYAENVRHAHKLKNVSPTMMIFIENSSGLRSRPPWLFRKYC